MNQRDKPHSNEYMKQALFNGNLMSVADSLQRICYPNYLKFFTRKGCSKEEVEDLFWNALYELSKKCKKETIKLTTTVCNYLFGFLKNYWRKLLRFKKQHPPALSLDDDFNDFFADPDELVLLSLTKKEEIAALRQCIEEVKRLNDRYPIILRAFWNGEKDKEIMKEMGYQNPRNVSVTRRRCFKEIKKRFMKHFSES